MKSTLHSAACCVLAVAMMTPRLRAEDAKSQTAKVVEAANAFLKTLDEKQRAGVMFKFDDSEQRARWSNFPTGFVPRAGMSLKQMSDRQQKSAMALVAMVLSERGYEKVQQIMEGDEVLKSMPDNGPGGGPGGGGRNPRGGGPPGGHGGPGGDMFGKDLYYIALLGTPSPWARLPCYKKSTIPLTSDHLLENEGSQTHHQDPSTSAAGSFRM